MAHDGPGGQRHQFERTRPCKSQLVRFGYERFHGVRARRFFESRRCGQPAAVPAIEAAAVVGSGSPFSSLVMGKALRGRPMYSGCKMRVNTTCSVTFNVGPRRFCQEGGRRICWNPRRSNPAKCRAVARFTPFVAKAAGFAGPEFLGEFHHCAVAASFRITKPTTSCNKQETWTTLLRIKAICIAC